MYILFYQLKTQLTTIYAACVNAMQHGLKSTKVTGKFIFAH